MRFRANKAAMLFLAAALAFFLVHTVSCAQEKIEGVGVNVAQLHDPEAAGGRGSLVVLDVLDKGPAKAAGLLPGDIIVEIDGKPTEGRDFDDLVKNAMMGPAGSKVTLTIKRTHTRETIRLAVTRAEISP